MFAVVSNTNSTCAQLAIRPFLIRSQRSRLHVARAGHQQNGDTHTTHLVLQRGALVMGQCLLAIVGLQQEM